MKLAALVVVFIGLCVLIGVVVKFDVWLWNF